MKIVTCAKCGKEIHRADRCCYCGGTDFLPTGHQIWVHENVETEFPMMEELLKQKEFSQVIDLTNIVLDWMPRCAEAYWMRLLARNGCVDDRELILLGVNLEDDGDFFNATRYGEDVENRTYTAVQERRESLESILLERLREHYRKELRELDLPGYRDALEDEIIGEEKRVLELCTRLWELELEICNLDQRAQLVGDPCREVTALAEQRLEAVRKEIYRMQTWNEVEYQKIQIRLGAVLELYEEGRLAREEMIQNHPWAQQYREMLEEQKRIRKELETIRKTLDDARKKGDELLASFQDLRREACQVIYSMSRDFDWVREILGEQVFRDCVNRADMVW